MPRVRKESGKKEFFQGQGIFNVDRENGNFDKSHGKVNMGREKIDFRSKIFVDHQYPLISVQ